MMSFILGLFTQVTNSGLQGPLVFNVNGIFQGRNHFKMYALLYINATLNERIFSGSGLWIKKINLCSCNNSSDFHYIFLTSQAPSCNNRHIQLLIEVYSLL